MGRANRPSRRSGKSRRAIRSVDAGVHRFDTYDEYKRVRMCASKIRYEAEMDAIDACIRQSRRHSACRMYKCERCGGYHLSKGKQL